MTSLPESPPVPPVIPVGLATKIGYVVGAGFAAVAAVTTVLDGDLTPETVTSMILSVLTFITLMGGRYFQAGKLYGTAPVVVTTPPLSDVPHDLSEEFIPPSSDSQLVEEGVLDPNEAEGPLSG